MLVLSRRVGEKLVIGNEIVIEVLAASNDGLRLGIIAPRETSVHRYEIFAEIQADNRRAANTELDRTAVENLTALLRTNT
jgi:carbon storage regulator